MDGRSMEYDDIPNRVQPQKLHIISLGINVVCKIPPWHL